jgi:hypothetical protein
MPPDDIRPRRFTLTWEAVGILFAILLAVSGGLKTWFLNDFRLEQLEKQAAAVDRRLAAIEGDMREVQATYRILLQQAEKHGWTVPAPNWSSEGGNP